MSLTVSLAPFQTLIYIFPTMLFFISLIARLILTFSVTNDPLQNMFSYAENLIADTFKEAPSLKDTSLEDVFAQFAKKKQEGESPPSTVSPKGQLVKQTNARRNSHFLYGLLIDSFALSFANGVIIMFESANLLTGFIFLFVGVMLCLIGFTTLYAGHPNGAIVVVLILLFVIFLTELLFLITSNSTWLFREPEYAGIGTVVIIVVAVVYERVKKKVVKNNSSSASTESTEKTEEKG